MARILTGIGYGCDSCLAPKSSWTDVDSIEDGFEMNRNYEETKETWRNLPRNSKGELVKSTGDYETRQGLCHPPVSLREPTSFSVTHKVLLPSLASTSAKAGFHLFLFDLTIHLKDVSRKFQGCFMEVSRVFQGHFKGVSRAFQGIFRGVS